MNLRRIIAIVLRQMFLLKRSLGRLFGVFYWPMMELFLWGVLTVYLNKVGGAAFNFVTVLLGALIFWDFFLRAQQSFSTSFLEDVWSRNLANLFASPLTIAELIFGFILTSLSMTLCSVAIMSGLAWLLFSFNIFQFGFLLLPYTALLFIFGWAIGILVSAIVLRFGPAAEVLAWSTAFLLQPLGAVFYPVEALPGILQPISKLIPLTHIFEGMRAAVLGGAFSARGLFIAAMLTAVYFCISVLIFAAAFRSARKYGYLVRYSTESF